MRIDPSQTYTCIICGKSFSPKSRMYAQRPPRCCSRECNAAYMRTRRGHGSGKILTHCDHCGKEMHLYPSQITDTNYCCNAHRHAHRQERFDSGDLKPVNKLTDEQLLDRVRRLASQLGHIPQSIDAKQRGNFDIACFRRFGTWAKTLERAGLISTEAAQQSKYTSAMLDHDTITTELRQLANQLGYTPTFEEMRIHGNFSTAAVLGVYGTWAAACEAAGLIPHSQHEGGNGSTRALYVKLTGVKVPLQSTYELRFARFLDSQQLDWLCHAEMKPIPYTTLDGTQHNYRPDFYVKEWNTYLDTKGWFPPEQQQKVAAIRASHPTMTLIIVTKPLLEMYERCIKQPLLPFQ